MARAALFLIVVGWLATDAMGAPASRERVVLADPDLELRHAMEQALAPWHLEVVIEVSPPADTAMAQERAEADTARFVVWRDGEQLVVYDRELGSAERRESRSGPLDPPTAAAAALTIKTMMRLPPPPVEAPVPQPVAPAEPGIDVRVQAGVATRIMRSTAIETAARFAGAVTIRPWSWMGLRFGIGGAAGTATSVDRASFKGTWNEWAVLGIVGWAIGGEAWELEPHICGGLRRSTLSGTEMNVPRSEAATLPTAGGGLAVRWRLARWSLGATVDADASFGTPTYSKTGTPAEIFQVPGVAVELGGVIAVDL
ncbi:MAG TPA: hypothetical protein VFT22_41530 [Kofleriaceae bacterium]|nr:hypothetical protein [Kofleriaceae bacterium]